MSATLGSLSPETDLRIMITDHLQPWSAPWLGLTLTLFAGCGSNSPIDRIPSETELEKALQATRTASIAQACLDNLLETGMALDAYRLANGTYPPVAITGKDGESLLSWRVAILPFFHEQQYKALYDEFHLGEPWDSPHNLALLPRMPEHYACPGERLEPGLTRHAAIRGDRTAFDASGTGTSWNDFSDGVGSTLLIVESAAPVPWSKPEDLNFDSTDDLWTRLSQSHDGGCCVVFADYKRFWIGPSKVPEDRLRAYATRNGGETVPEPSN